MKKVTLLFILMLSLLLGKGQSLLEEGKLWSNTSKETEGGSTYRSYFIKFGAIQPSMGWRTRRS